MILNAGGWFLMTGTGVPQDKRKGLKWIHKATFQGYQPAIDYCKENEVLIRCITTPHTWNSSGLSTLGTEKYLALLAPTHKKTIPFMKKKRYRS